jgi:hypothetical protein
MGRPLVVLLGSQINAAGRRRGWYAGRGSPPDAEELAVELARKFDLDPETLDLADVAQEVQTTEGAPSLGKAVTQVLSQPYEPGPVHRFLARLPRTLVEMDLRERYQMLISMNYDTALERAFHEAGEPYDLAIFIPGETNKGKFVHAPWHGEARVIDQPSEYRDLFEGRSGQ